MKNLLLYISVFLGIFLLGCQKNVKSSIDGSASVMIVSASSDGQFAISSHRDNQLILWDLKTRGKKIISTNANIYSAYFIKHSDKFIWQDLNDTVFVQDNNGNVIKSFSHPTTYGQVMSSDFEKYFSSDIGSGIDHLGIDRKISTLKASDGKSFLGFGKLLNLVLDDQNHYLLSSVFSYDYISEVSVEEEIKKNNQFMDMSGVVLWNTDTKKPAAKFMGHAAKTTATLSPDGKYTVSGCENGIGFVWDNQTGNQIVRLASLYHGILETNGTDDYEKWTRDKTGLIPPPEDLDSNEATMALKFINGKNYLRFLTYSSYAVLYDIDSPLPLKYLPLGRDPFPAVSDYSRNAAIDTAPDAGVLVMGQRDGSGIIVYKYHPEKQELEKVWVGE